MKPVLNGLAPFAIFLLKAALGFLAGWLAAVVLGYLGFILITGLLTC